MPLNFCLCCEVAIRALNLSENEIELLDREILIGFMEPTRVFVKDLLDGKSTRLRSGRKSVPYSLQDLSNPSRNTPCETHMTIEWTAAEVSQRASPNHQAREWKKITSMKKISSHCPGWRADTSRQWMACDRRRSERPPLPPTFSSQGFPRTIRSLFGQGAPT